MRQIALLCVAWMCFLAESGCNYNYPVPLDAQVIAQDFSMPQDMLSPPCEQRFTLTASPLVAGDNKNCQIFGSIGKLPLQLTNTDTKMGQFGSLCGALIEIKVDGSSVIKADNAKWILKLHYSRPVMMKLYSVAIFYIYLESGTLLVANKSEEQDDSNTIQKEGSMADPISHIFVAISSRSGGWACRSSDDCFKNMSPSSFVIDEISAKYVIAEANNCRPS